MKINKIQELKEKGITLIALVITIIILLILVGVTLFQLSGENGLFEIAKNARKQYEIEKYIEEIEIARGDIQVEKRRTETLDELVQRIKDDKIIEGGTISKVDEETAKAVTKEGYILTIKSKKVSTYEGNNNIKQTGLIGEIQGIKESGIQTVEVEGKTNEGTVENKSYSLDVIVHNGDLILDGEKEVEGATLTNKVYEFGKAEDVATASENAKNMVVLKVNGDLTIKEGVTLTSVKSSSNYGGPKGMTIYCTGTLTNDGTISMTARGARAVGENVYLWENTNGSFEYVPAVGASGGSGYVINSGENAKNGRNGLNGIGRQTGGGGSGSGLGYARVATIGSGASGSSYSGGSGSGAATSDGNSAGNVTSSNASGNGGAGSNGVDNSGNSSNTAVVAMGGTGNPSGNHDFYRRDFSNYNYKSGTGGLLVIFAPIILNNNVICADGITSSDSIITNLISSPFPRWLFWRRKY